VGILRLILAGALLLAAAGSTPAQNHHAAKAGGRFSATVTHGFGDVEHWVSVFDDPSRAEWQKPSQVVQALALAPGMRVADLGAGTGYFSRYLSNAVGPTGTIFAVDTEPKLVEHLRQRAELEKTANLVPVLASPDNPRLPVGMVDLVLLVDTYHHLDQRLDYLRRLATVLSPRGRIAIVDWKKQEAPVGPRDLEHKLARDQVVGEMKDAGYRLGKEYEFLPYQYFLVFEPS
jgi:ubiquinone/menaquinone biosynthesis C-methylase UbiE